MAGFYNPVWLLGLLLIPVLAVLYWLVCTEEETGSARSSRTSRL